MPRESDNAVTNQEGSTLSSADSVSTVALIDQARRALTEARSMHDIRQVMELASLATDYARRWSRLAQAEEMAVQAVEAANEAANDAAAVRIEAQVKAGELLEAMERRPGAQPSPTGEAASEYRRTLRRERISEGSAERWRNVAAIPADVRVGYIERMKMEHGEVTTSGLRRHAAMLAAEKQDELIAQAEDLLRPDAKQDVADKRLRLTVSTALNEVHRDLLPLDPEAVARVLPSDRRDGLRRSISRIRDWCDRMERAIDSNRLEVIDGTPRG